MPSDFFKRVWCEANVFLLIVVLDCVIDDGSGLLFLLQNVQIAIHRVSQKNYPLNNRP